MNPDLTLQNRDDYLCQAKHILQQMLKIIMPGEKTFLAKSSSEYTDQAQVKTPTKRQYRPSPKLTPSVPCESAEERH
jgi:hypothetical protein